jgi:hypothetical protein
LRRLNRETEAAIASGRPRDRHYRARACRPRGSVVGKESDDPVIRFEPADHLKIFFRRSTASNSARAGSTKDV